MILDRINENRDIKALSINELNELAEEIRSLILNRVNTVGGHLGPDLGIVEATLALHYVFSCPVDKFVFDVSHQCYPHKIITGRKRAFSDPLGNPDISGYFNPEESECDTFVIGHTSTSISLATGLAKARDIKGENHNVVALIGDGSLTGGEALEGLNNSACLNSNFIIVVNDNEMSIAENYGGIYENLRELRETNGKAQNNFFKTIGFEYHYLEDGNNVEKLIELFKSVKDTNKPVICHIHTLKGKGYEPAENLKEMHHWITPNFMDKKEEVKSYPIETYDKITTDFLYEKYQKDKRVVVVNPATPGAVGLSPNIREKFGKNYTDVGIAEEHAMAYVSGLAKAGCKPVLTILSSFVQRTYDQISQDLALNNSPATILVYWGAISSSDMTHLGVFDIPLISNIPNVVYLAPTNKEEYLKMLDWSIEQNEHTVFIRVPFVGVTSMGKADETDYSILNKYEIKEKGEEIAILGLGNFYSLALNVAQKIKEELKITPTLINPKFITGLDCELLENLKASHKLTITLEDGVLDGGFGEKISRFYSSSDMKVLNYGAFKEFTDRAPLDELYEKYHLTPELILEDVKKILN